MLSQKPTDRKLIMAVDACFIDIIGPIAQLLIEDAKNLWRQKKWQGPSAMRNYIKALAVNIDTAADKQQFLQLTSQIIMDAEGSRKQSL